MSSVINETLLAIKTVFEAGLTGTIDNCVVKKG